MHLWQTSLALVKIVQVFLLGWRGSEVLGDRTSGLTRSKLGDCEISYMAGWR